jgi:C-terminal processing protease CtpA/Prc
MKALCPCGKERRAMWSNAERLGGVILMVSVAFVTLTGACYAKGDAWLGVVLQPLSEELKEAMDIDRDVEGVLVSDIVDKSPADEYGLEDGDIITAIDDEEVDSVREAINAIKMLSPGDEIEVAVVRDGKEKKIIEVELGERKQVKMVDRDLGFMPGIGKSYKWIGETQGFLGVEVHDMSEDLADYFDVAEDEGVLILRVQEDSPAEEAGLMAGDVVLEIDGREVNDTEGLVEYVREGDPGDQVDLKIKRKRRTQTIEVTLGETKGPGRMMVKELDLPHKRLRIMMPDEIEMPDLDEMEIYRWHEEDLKDDLEELREELEELREELEELRKS